MRGQLLAHGLVRGPAQPSDRHEGERRACFAASMPIREPSLCPAIVTPVKRSSAASFSTHAAASSTSISNRGSSSDTVVWLAATRACRSARSPRPARLAPRRPGSTNRSPPVAAESFRSDRSAPRSPEAVCSFFNLRCVGRRGSGRALTSRRSRTIVPECVLCGACVDDLAATRGSSVPAPGRAASAPPAYCEPMR